ncbi:unnamed protein product [Polarella glacialis]|uniref:Uncharacterized protein n=1 Tax=Polarella glacialis TaxID=89957 RepID=A0A813GBD5_POLGL|nr:unnamed protein product [Polarella glacialis]
MRNFATLSEAAGLCAYAAVRSVHAADPSCSSAMLAAARLGDVRQLQLSLQLGESVLCVDPLGETPLHVVAENGHDQAALALLAAGATFGFDQLGRAPLHLACSAGHGSVANLLLDARSYIDVRDAAERAPLHHAARQGHTSVVRLLLDRGATIDALDGDGRSALHHSSRLDKLLNTTELLMTRGSNIEVADLAGFRPLHFACNENQLATSMRLLEAGADPWAFDKSGWNPFIHAAAMGYTSLVDALVANAVKPALQPLADPSMIIHQDPSTAVSGIPAWTIAVLLFVLSSVCVCCIGRVLIRRFANLKKKHDIDDVDQATEHFLDEVFGYMAQRS